MRVLVKSHYDPKLIEYLQREDSPYQFVPYNPEDVQKKDICVALNHFIGNEPYTEATIGQNDQMSRYDRLSVMSHYGFNVVPFHALNKENAERLLKLYGEYIHKYETPYCQLISSITEDSIKRHAERLTSGIAQKRADDDSKVVTTYLVGGFILGTTKQEQYPIPRGGFLPSMPLKEDRGDVFPSGPIADVGKMRDMGMWFTNNYNTILTAFEFMMDEGEWKLVDVNFNGMRLNDLIAAYSEEEIYTELSQGLIKTLEKKF